MPDGLVTVRSAFDPAKTKARLLALTIANVTAALRWRISPRWSTCFDFPGTNEPCRKQCPVGAVPLFFGHGEPPCLSHPPFASSFVSLALLLATRLASSSVSDLAI